jgi:tetratricopeptide (TPR) repeat protein
MAGEEDLVRTARESLAAGDSAVAELLCRRVLERDPAHAAALSLTVFVQLSQARYGEALPLVEQLCRLEPQERAHWVNLGNAYRGAGAHEDALKAFARALDLGERSAGVYYNLGLTHIARGDFEAGRAVLQRALQLQPDDIEIRYRYVICCYKGIRFDLALEALEGWTAPASAPPEIVAGVGQMLLNMGEYQRAQAAIEQAERGAEAEPATLLILAQVLERTNRLEEAESIRDRLAASSHAIRLGSEFQRVSAKLAQRRGLHELAIELYRQAEVEYREPHERHYILFPIAESLHALGRHDEAIATLMEAHRSHAEFIRRSKPLAALRGTPTMEVTQFHCDPEDVARWDHAGAPDTAHSPVFIVAFPRSGTTLLELVLDSHPLLRSMDEQPFIQNALEDIQALGVMYPEQLAGIDPGQLERIRANYWRRVAHKVTLEPGQRLVDKNPLNILRLPVIRRLFPQARILLAIRHPCDVILSCYRQHFQAPDFSMLCADMPSLFIGYRKTFDFWYEHVAMLRPSVLEVRYESLVGDFEAQVRRIAAFLELPWDPAMLRPAQRAHQKRYISTPSYSQVVQPVNAGAVGRWQAYRRYLEPGLPVLQPYLQRWGYEA